mgnify:CR=1 FL=1
MQARHLILAGPYSCLPMIPTPVDCLIKHFLNRRHVFKQHQHLNTNREVKHMNGRCASNVQGEYLDNHRSRAPEHFYLFLHFEIVHTNVLA